MKLLTLLRPSRAGGRMVEREEMEKEEEEEEEAEVATEEELATTPEIIPTAGAEQYQSELTCRKLGSGGRTSI